jgi:KDEL-tailed cysteine endopeptidase
MPEATCCDDKEHCCPTELPVCDTAMGRCLPSKGVMEGSAPWATKTPATFKGWPWSRSGAAGGAAMPMAGRKGGCHKTGGGEQAGEEAVVAAA